MNKNFNLKTSDVIGVVIFLLLLFKIFHCDNGFSQKTEKETGYKSAVPQYTFPNSLEAQNEALKTNPMIKRFAESREDLSENPYRPVYHFVNPEGKMNDPNGFTFWKGNWHLFFQAYPPEDPRQHWGHAVSKDLIHWRDLPLAIYPGPEKKSFSGSAFVEDDRVLAMYDGTEAGIMAAKSNDPLLLNWKKITGGSVIPLHDDLPIEPVRKFRIGDPFLWKKGGMYYAIIGGRKPYGREEKPIRANYLFKSKDLKTWEYMHPFVEGDRFTRVRDDGSTPYFWPIGDRHILLFYSHIRASQYLLGDYDKERDKFVATTHGYFNHGSVFPGGVHAVSATPDDQGGIIAIFNMNPGKPTEGWNQIMTLPKRLTLKAKDTLGIEPAGSIESLRYDHQKLGRRTLPANEEVVFENISGDALEILARIDPKQAKHVELRVLRSPDKAEYTSINFYKDRGYRNRDAGTQNSSITIDTKYSSILPGVRSRLPEIAPLHLRDGEVLELRVFIDKSVVEVYANGKQYAAVRVYPGLKGSVGLSMRSQGQKSELISLDSWKMKNIWNLSLDEWQETSLWSAPNSRI